MMNFLFNLNCHCRHGKEYNYKLSALSLEIPPPFSFLPLSLPLSFSHSPLRVELRAARKKFFKKIWSSYSAQIPTLFFPLPTKNQNNEGGVR